MARASRVNQLKQTRSKTLTLRMDPRIVYMVELLSRQQRRTLTSIVEESLVKLLSSKNIPNSKYAFGDSRTIDVLYHHEESDRIVRLATLYPDLLTHTEFIAWTYIKEHDELWMTNDLDCEVPNMPLIRERWSEIKSYALGEKEND